VSPTEIGASSWQGSTALTFYVHNFQQFIAKSPNEYSFSFVTYDLFPEQVFVDLAVRFPRLAFSCDCIEDMDERMGFGWFDAPAGGEDFRRDYRVPKNYWSSGRGYKRSRRAQFAHKARTEALLKTARKSDRLHQLFRSAYPT
jgi:hypothetical protein